LLRIALPFLLILAACGGPATTAQTAPAPAAAPAPPPVYSYHVVATYPHDTRAFTEGLFYLDGQLYESTGLVGASNIRRVSLADGRVLQSVDIPQGPFGEGIVNWGREIISLTWQGGVGYRWDRATLRRTGEWHYPGEGWALTQNGTDIIMSDGTPELRFLDPRTLAERRRLTVTASGRPVQRLNELEWVRGRIYANVWMTPLIAIIDPANGHVTGIIDLRALVAENSAADPDAVLNGIAYDAAHDRLFVTGKNWAHLYEIDLVPPAAVPA
jgi:glutaminyl-peptide cyclotransferase